MSLFGSPAEASAPRPAPDPSPAPPALRRAAVVVGVEALVLAGIALWLLFLTITSTADSVARALAEVVYVGLCAGALGAAAAGLWRVARWARGPVIALQLLLGIVAWTTASTGGLPLVGVPVLVLVAAVLYLLATPEARLAYLDR